MDIKYISAQEKTVLFSALYKYREFVEEKAKKPKSRKLYEKELKLIESIFDKVG